MIWLPFFQHLTPNGQPSSSTNSPDVTGDYSNPAEFFVVPPIGTVLELHTLTISVVAPQGVPFVRTGYGALSVLPGALQLRLYDGATPLVDITPPIKTLPDWHAVGATCPEQVLYTLIDAHRADFTLDLRRVFGDAVTLDSRTSVSLNLHVDGNLTGTGLTEHRFAVLGRSCKTY